MKHPVVRAARDIIEARTGQLTISDVRWLAQWWHDMAGVSPEVFPEWACVQTAKTLVGIWRARRAAQ